MKNIRILFVFLLVIVSFQFFDARFLNKSIVNIVTYAFLTISILVSVPYFFRKKGGFILPVQLIVLSIVISVPMVQLGWDQSWKDTLIATVPFMSWIFFFYLLHIEIPVKTIEKIALIYGVLYILLFFFQLAHSPTVLFGKSIAGWDKNEFSTSRGIARIVFPGAGVFFLVTFIAITKITIKAKRKWLWLSLTVLGIIIPVLQVTRQFIFSVCVIYFYHFTKHLAGYKRIIILGVAICFCFYIININNSLVKGIAKATKTDLKEGDNYVRVQAGDYFLNNFSPSNINKIFGNGASYGSSEYGTFINYLQYRYGFYKSDVGIIGMYAMFGILAVIGYIIIWIKSFTIPLPEEYYYLKYYLWFLLLTSLTWYSVYHYHYLITTVFVLYLYHTISPQTLEV